jgi:hypothetical protein
VTLSPFTNAPHFLLLTHHRRLLTSHIKYLTPALCIISRTRKETEESFFNVSEYPNKERRNLIYNLLINTKSRLSAMPKSNTSHPHLHPTRLNFLATLNPPLEIPIEPLKPLLRLLPQPHHLPQRPLIHDPPQDARELLLVHERRSSRRDLALDKLEHVFAGKQLVPGAAPSETRG